MLAASPITRQTAGRTFIVAASLLTAVGLTQAGVLFWAYAHRPPGPPRTISIAALKGEPTTPDTDKLDVADTLVTSDTPSAKPVEPSPDAIAALTPPRPVPLAPRAPTLMEPEQSDRYKETLSLGKLLRERSDMSTALTRFREAAAMDPKNPEPLYELAVTFEKMSLPDKAAEQWRRIYEMGETASAFYTAAEARLHQARQTTMQTAAPAIGEATPEVEDGIDAGKTLGLMPIKVTDEEDRTSAKKLSLTIPIKARSPRNVSVRDLTIQVLFYDTVDNQNLVQTTANVSSRWTTAPADWVDSNIETLEVEYQLPLPDAKAARRENRKYFGYLVRIYYKGELQAAAGAPERLVQQFQPEPKLPDDTHKK